ncbi:oligoendopeptidase [Paenibacillus swuensis]|uniref:Oligoendopeptidase n=1 Tax=Paenibacillus swuensis TaxID=1178515 RepID=A0A172TNE4_9BACL|nr:M3 family oligoendopeptidase [Paenibacillus swuensis]ANE48609.1 oligoendopeptidase [Paenibacillus swuensis]
MNQTRSQVWNLDTIFSGGSNSPAFNEFLQQVEQDIVSFMELVHKPSEAVFRADDFDKAVTLMQSLTNRLREAGSFVECLTAQNQKDKKAVQLTGKFRGIHARFLSSLTYFDLMLTQIPDDNWNALLKSEDYRNLEFNLNERRHLASEKMAPELEALANDLAVDGYHGWGALYETTVSQIQISYEDQGESRMLSAGQAFNKLHSADRQVREEMSAKWEAEWERKEDFCADALNHLGGFRLQLYKGRRWDAVLKEPLAINRMSENTLSAMWDAINRKSQTFLDFLQRKAQLLGLERLNWHDVDAPLGKASKEYSYDEAAEIIVEQFRKFSPKMADFAHRAFEEQWIEVEDRPGKGPGGFCTSFPFSKQTRIFMTFSGTASNVSTLAHELGHAYHQYIMEDMPALAQDYAMNVAETASTFAELIVSDAAVKQAENDEEKLTLLEDKIQRSIAFFLNIQARFLFETRFYEKRKEGLVSAVELSELMVQAQKDAYHNVLGEYHPHFWASKMHFYITEVPFYNFPYTFGYLFSFGIFARALKEGTDFEDKYISLLQDTGRMTVEELAHKHLNVDLTQPDFWNEAVGLCVQDVEAFLDMTAS